VSRSVKEWIGKTPDTKVPPRVRLRVFDAHGGICYLSGIKIMPGMPWDLEHVIALHAGGENRESNLRPALRDKHKVKTAAEMAVKAKVSDVRKAALGIKSPKAKIPSPPKAAKPVRDKLPLPPRRAMFTSGADA